MMDVGFLNGSGSWWDEAAELGVLLVAGGVLWFVARLNRRKGAEEDEDEETTEEQNQSID